jgi:NDP-sugar pyrophosphorylase family protein
MIRAGIIAAGDGSRLSSVAAVKPLVTVAGKPLIHWIVEGLRFAGANKITVLTNSRGGAVPTSLKASFPSTEFDFVTADTASSFESFRLVALRMADQLDGDFIISTTDALIRNEDLARFVTECRAARADAGLALTQHVDDEKPLWADVDEVGLVRALGADAKTRRFVTCGAYYLTRSAAKRLPAADAHGRLRDYLSGLAAEARTAGVVLSKSLDVDRPADLAAAEAFLTTETKR